MGTMMNPRWAGELNLLRWADALESEGYPRNTDNRLACDRHLLYGEMDTAYSAVGVGCLIAGLIPDYDPDTREYDFGAGVDIIPQEFFNWLGADTIGRRNMIESLDMASWRHGFQEVADLIRTPLVLSFWKED